MKLLVQGNNVDKAADMAITILSVVDNNDQLKRDETVRSMMPRFEGQKQNKTTAVSSTFAWSGMCRDQSRCDFLRY